METGHLIFDDNACRIDLKVAGGESKASGFIYITDPFCHYDYVLTAKHAFQEENEEPTIKKLRFLEISWKDVKGELITSKIDDSELENNLFFMDNCDLAIIKIVKSLQPAAKRIAVKNITELEKGCLMESVSYPIIKRDVYTHLQYTLKDQINSVVKAEEGIKLINNFKGISGSGIYLQKEPFLVSVVAGTRLPDFELNEIQLSLIDWDHVNERLIHRGWVPLYRGNSRKTKITSEQDIIDIRQLEVNGAVLNMETAIKNLHHDLTDDWYFDPLQYTDVCHTEFVLDYFSSKKRREQYTPSNLEEFYLPKPSLVLRKALVGTFIDRLVYMAVVSQLAPTIDSHLNKYVFSARFDKKKNAKGLIVQGVEQWTKMNYLIAHWINIESTGCLVKLDVLNYYDNINKQTLIRLLREIVSSYNEKACVELLKLWLEKSGKEEDYHGIPQNSDASSLLATFYLSHIDEFIKTNALHFCRFMDDIYFIAEDIYKARDLMQTIEKLLRQVDLSLNAQKVTFVRLDVKKEKEEFLNNLSLFDYEKLMIRSLMKSSSKARRMNGIAMLAKQFNRAMEASKDKTSLDQEQSRALKFSVNALTSYRLELALHWDKFYDNLKDLAHQLVDIPEQTPLFCKLISSIRKDRDINDLKEIIIKIVLRNSLGIYDWQAYYLWMLLAYLKCDDKRLMKYAAEEIEKNDETKRVEIAAIFIYMATVNPEYSRILLHKLREGHLHGNLQVRCALIACRNLDPSILDNEARTQIDERLSDYLKYLHRNKEKDLVFFYRISPYYMERYDNTIIPEYYSGL